MMRHLLFGGGGTGHHHKTHKPPSVAPATAAAFKSEVLLYVNGRRCVVQNPDPGMLLATYLRETLRLTGTKVACGEGGCGACTVLLGRLDPATGASEFLPVNACLRPLCACDGMAVVTVEGMGGSGKVGNSSEGPHPIQERLAKGNGTQCGFCSPGWVTSCYGLLLQQQQDGAPPLTEQEVERHFAGNLCRCTGYRPILEAFKSLALDRSDDDGNKGKKGPRRLGVAGEEEGEEWVHVEAGRCLHATDAAAVAAPAAAAAAGGGGGNGGGGGGACSGHHQQDQQHVCIGDMEDLCTGREQQQQHSSSVLLSAPNDKAATSTSVTKGRVRASQSAALAPEARKRALSAAADAPPFPEELKEYQPQPLRIVGGPGNGKTWCRVFTVPDLLGVLREEGGKENKRVQVVVGNTAVQGLTKYYNGSFPANTPDTYDVMVDASAVPEMHDAHYDDDTNSLSVGAAVSLNRLAALLRQHDDSGGRAPAGFPYGQSVFGMLASHLKKIAGEQVRNAASWAGGLMLFKQYPDFPSDTNLVFAAAGARLSLAYVNTDEVSECSMQEFWALDSSSNPSVILKATLANTITPPANHDKKHGGQEDGSMVVARSFRVAQRACNAHAHTNAAFVARLAPSSSSGDSSSSSSSSNGSYPMCYGVRIAVAGVSKTAFRATQAESAMQGRALDESTLALALTALEQDLATAGGGESSHFGSPGFRVQLMRALLYKFFLVAQGDPLPPRLASAVSMEERPASKASQTYTPDASLSPVSQPVPKVDGLLQTTGEAVYVDDEPLPQNALHGAYVFSTKALAKVARIDMAAALQVVGVHDVVTAQDIPGKNDLTSGAGDELLMVPEGGVCQCVGQALAVVLADTAEAARAGARAVLVTYEETGETPVLSFVEGIERKSFLPAGSVKEISCGDAETALKASKHRKAGRIETGGQKHFYLEPQTTLAVPTEDGKLSLYTSSQAPADTHTLVSKVLALPKHRLSVQVRRAGGGFGAKLTRCYQNAAAAAVCARKLGRPVRVSNDRTTDMVMVGGREPLLVDYDVGFDDQGKVTGLTYRVYMDAGAATDNTAGDNDMAMQWIDNAYYFENFKAEQFVVKTNLPVTTSMRAPGVVQAVLATEKVLAEVARELGLPLQAVQEANFYKDGDSAPYGQVLEDTSPLQRVWDGAKALGQLEARKGEVAVFNAQHRWRKRGLCLTPVKYGMGWAGIRAAASVKVYQEDGSVLINHHGCEVGQGIHTKVAQAAAYKLGVPLERITIAPTATDKIPNGTATGGSGTSETAVQAMLSACDALTARLAPYRAKLGGDSAAWADVVAAAAAEGVDLSAEGWFAPQASDTGDPFQYFIWCAGLCVVEVDVLTGEVCIPHAEIVYDCGQALNPLVDIGQIEGAFIQGVGYYLHEDVRFDDQGRLLTTGTWLYKPPSALDIPLEFNVTLIPKDLNPAGVLQSKATGEPPYMLATALYFALLDCIREAHREARATHTTRTRRILKTDTHHHHHAAAATADDETTVVASLEQGPYEDVPLPIPATLDHRVLALGVEAEDMVLR